MNPIPNDPKATPIRSAGLPPKTRNALMEAGLRTVEAVEAASDTILDAIPQFGPKRTADLRGRLRAYRAKPPPAPRKPAEPEPMPGEAPDGPALPEFLAAAAGIGQPGGAILVLRMGLGPEGRFTRVAVAARLGMSVGIVERRERRAMLLFRKAPVVRAIGRRVAQLSETQRGRLAAAVAAEPWAGGLTQDCLFRLCLWCWGVNLRRGNGRDGTA